MFGLPSIRSTRGIAIDRKIAAFSDVFHGRASITEVVNRELKKTDVLENQAKSTFAGWRTAIIKAGRNGDARVLELCKDEGIDIDVEPKARKTKKKATPKLA